MSNVGVIYTYIDIYKVRKSAARNAAIHHREISLSWKNKHTYSAAATAAAAVKLA